MELISSSLLDRIKIVNSLDNKIDELIKNHPNYDQLKIAMISVVNTSNRASALSFLKYALSLEKN